MRERSKKWEKEEEQLPKSFIDENGNEWAMHYELVKTQGIEIIDCRKEYIEELVAYGEINPCRVALMHLALSIIRRLYLMRPTTDEVLLARTNAVDRLFLGSLHEPAEEIDPDALITQPPRSGEFLISLFVPREKRDEVIGSLSVYYTDMEEEYGARLALLLYWKEVARSIGPVLQRSIQWLIKYKVFSALGEIIRHLRPH